MKCLSTIYRATKCHLWPVWPDLAKFHHFGKSLQVFGQFLMVYFLTGKMLSPLWQIGNVFGLIFITANGQILKNIISIWSHWLQCRSRFHLNWISFKRILWAANHLNEIHVLEYLSLRSQARQAISPSIDSFYLKLNLNWFQSCIPTPR